MKNISWPGSETRSFHRKAHVSQLNLLPELCTDQARMVARSLHEVPAKAGSKVDPNQAATQEADPRGRAPKNQPNDSLKSNQNVKQFYAKI